MKKDKLNLFSFEEFLDWIDSSCSITELIGFYSCAFFHKDGATEIPLKMKEKIFDLRSSNFITANLLLRIWEKREKKHNITNFIENEFDLDEYNGIFDLDYELQVIFDLEPYIDDSNY